MSIAVGFDTLNKDFSFSKPSTSNDAIIFTPKQVQFRGSFKHKGSIKTSQNLAKLP